MKVLFISSRRTENRSRSFIFVEAKASNDPGQGKRGGEGTTSKSEGGTEGSYKFLVSAECGVGRVRCSLRSPHFVRDRWRILGTGYYRYGAPTELGESRVTPGTGGCMERDYLVGVRVMDRGRPAPP